MLGVEGTARTAAKEHACAGCRDKIKRNDRYMEQVLPPWALIADDVDEDGRPIGSPAGEWIRSRMHLACFDKMMWGMV